MNTKFCPICNESKDVTLFSRRLKNKDKLDTYCRSCSTAKSREWNKNNKYRRREINKSYSIKNRDKVLKDMRDWYQNNREYAIKKVSQRIAQREKTDINFKISRLLRSRLCSALKHNLKSGSAVKNLGCTIQELRLHLESKFQPGMTWENHGKWHIDHIVPLCSFDLTDIEQLKKACHYTNLQPLWPQQNLNKRFIDGSIEKKE